MKPNIQLKLRKVNEITYVIGIQGEVTSFAENALMDAFAQATSDNGRQVILNFDGLVYMNSSGIGLLVTLLIRANRQGQQLIAVGLNDHYRQIFELTRLNEAIRIFDSEENALAMLSG